MNGLIIRIHRKNEPEPVFPEILGKPLMLGHVDRVAVLEGGMQSGATSVAVLATTQLNGGDVTLMIEMSGAQLEALAGCVRGADARFKENPL